MSTDATAHEVYVAGHAEFAADRSGEPGWLATLRSAAIAAFAESGFPTRRLEDWRYTNIAPIVREPFALAGVGAQPVDRDAVAASAVMPGAPGSGATPELVFIDGCFDAGLSTAATAPRSGAAGVRAVSLATLLREDPDSLDDRLGRDVDVKRHPFAALNTAYLDDGAVICVPRDVDAREPVMLRFLSRGGATRRISHPRVLVTAEPGSRGVLVLDFASLAAGAHLTNAVIELRVAANAELEVVVLQRESDDAAHVSLLHAQLERDSRLRSHVVTAGGGLVRNDLEALLADEGADCTLNGLFLGSGTRRIDNHTLVDHAVPHGTSRELYKGVLGDRSRGVFRGRVVVRPGAQKTDASQSNPNLITSLGAEVDTRPQLEIYADDVKCSHGSTIGQLDPEALFFLRARGIAEADARELLTRGFASEILEVLPVAALRAPLADRILARSETQRGDRQ